MSLILTLTISVQSQEVLTGWEMSNIQPVGRIWIVYHSIGYPIMCVCSLIAKFLGPTRGPSGADSIQVGPMLAPWTLLSGLYPFNMQSLVLYSVLSSCHQYLIDSRDVFPKLFKAGRMTLKDRHKLDCYEITWKQQTWGPCTWFYLLGLTII